LAIPGSFPATAMPDPDWWQALWPHPAEVLTALGLNSNMSALDLCCGDGLFTTPMAKMAHRAFAIDLDPAMLARAEQKSRAAGAACTYLAGDAYSVPELLPQPVDFVLLANTFHGVPDKPQLARALATVLRPGGRLAIVNWHKRSRQETVVRDAPRGPPTQMRMSPAETAAALAQGGLAMRNLVELPPYHYGAVFVQPDSQARRDERR
jgi:ubiquinone/menaquinone biosynthesis C-methylase UbiE